MHQGAVIGRARDLNEGTECDGWIDSPDQHVKLWDILPMLGSLRQVGKEYQDVPRGRVIWNQKANTPVIYMDKKLLRSETTKKKVAVFFELDASTVQWKSDPHYTTDTNEIFALLDE